MSYNSAPSILPSGEDANPLNRRLPAEVVTRRRREVKKVEEKPADEVQVDVKVALSLKPEARFKWLGKAFKMAEEGRASATDLYDIVANRKFASGLPAKIGRKARAVVQENLELFSDKQQRYLRSDDWALNAPSYGDKADEQDKDEELAAPVSGIGTTTFAAKVSSSATGIVVKDARDDKDGKSSEGGVWTVAEDISARQRAQALEKARREAEQAKRQAEMQARQREEQERRRSAEADEAKRRALENEVDSSLMLLERLGQSKRAPSPVLARRDDRAHRDSDRDRRDRDKGKRRGLSRSRSISARGSSSSRGRRNKRKRSRSRDRDRKGKKESKENFEDALRRRMAEREGEIDSARIPVVDPGHAKRWA